MSASSSFTRPKPMDTWFCEMTPWENRYLSNATHLAWVASSRSSATTTARFTASWWKWGTFKSRRQRAASAWSLDRKNSFTSMRTACLRSLVSPAAGPHTFSRRALPWRMDSRTLASFTISPPRSSTMGSDKNDGGSTSSTTARPRNCASILWASGLSSSRSSASSNKRSNPLPTWAMGSTSGYSVEMRRDASSRSRSLLSSDMVTARFTSS
mmetsp:Transcript_35544/g.72600  ORF Transcript_35544/g.72600 Transcript_35544/m.72600 type:complete len:212 (-) Transcript_35544:732-1367(-)